jgi:hypothetical protein
MKTFPKLAANRRLKVTIILLAICCVLLAGAFVVRISGNWPGILLCYAASTALVLAFVHHWRKVKYFLVLLGASVAGFFIFVLLHNVFYGLGVMASDIVVLSGLLEFLHAVSFLIAVILSPAALLVGATGSVITGIMYFKARGTKEK